MENKCIFFYQGGRIITRATASAISVEGKSSHSRSRDPSGSRVGVNTGSRSRDPSSGSKGPSRRRESSGSPRRNSGSPKMPRPRSEEIPLEDMKSKVNTKVMFNNLIRITIHIKEVKFFTSKSVKTYCCQMLPMVSFKLHH